MQCSHCGREVRETRHTQKGYRVDYYLLHTGRSDRATFKDPKDDMVPLSYLKLVQPVNVVSCTECYADPEIRRWLDDDFKGLRSILDARPAKEPEQNQIPNRHD